MSDGQRLTFQGGTNAKTVDGYGFDVRVVAGGAGNSKGGIVGDIGNRLEMEVGFFAVDLHQLLPA